MKKSLQENIMNTVIRNLLITSLLFFLYYVADRLFDISSIKPSSLFVLSLLGISFTLYLIKFILGKQ